MAELSPTTKDPHRPPETGRRGGDVACAGPTHVCWLKAAVPRETRGLPAPHQTSQPRVLVPGRDVPATSGGGHSVCTTGTLLLGGGASTRPRKL